jgi:hypothetical protein
MHVSVPLLAAMALIGSAQGTVKELDKKDLIEIDGAKDPSLIPEWLAWEHSFMLLRDWHGKDSGFTHDLREALLPHEWELLDQEGLAQNTRQARRESRAAKWLEKYPYSTTTDPAIRAKANDEGFAIDLDYRREMLAARDRLLAAFSTESQVVLLNWLAENKTAITSFVRKTDLNRWRLPE